MSVYYLSLVKLSNFIDSVKLLNLIKTIFITVSQKILILTPRSKIIFPYRGYKDYDQFPDIDIFAKKTSFPRFTLILKPIHSSHVTLS